jgi:hypothetical protein
LLDGLSGRTGRRVLDAMDDIWATFKAHREFVPVSRSTKSEGFQIRPSQDGRVSSLRGLEEVPSDLDSNAFWQAFQDGTIPSWTHRDRLRAAYMVLLKARERNQGILQLVEPFRAKEDAIHGNHSAWNRYVIPKERRGMLKLREEVRWQCFGCLSYSPLSHINLSTMGEILCQRTLTTSFPENVISQTRIFVTTTTPKLCYSASEQKSTTAVPISKTSLNYGTRRYAGAPIQIPFLIRNVYRASHSPSSAPI